MTGSAMVLKARTLLFDQAYANSLRAAFYQQRLQYRHLRFQISLDRRLPAQICPPSTAFHAQHSTSQDL